MVGRARLHDGGRVIDLREADEGMAGAAGDDSPGDLGTEPGQERLKPAGKEGQEQGRDRWQIRDVT
jgi:hypothetical protein